MKTSNSKLCMATIAALVLISQATLATGKAKPIETVPNLDLKSYVGVWREYAFIPFYFERMCVLDTTAEYSILEDGRVSVKNSCVDKDGEVQVANGIAKIPDPKVASKLKVTFAKIFGKWIFTPGGDYWIMEVGANYEYALLGSPDRKYSWILSRTPQLERSLLVRLAEKLRDAGYNPCDLMLTPQTGGNKERASLCTLTQ